MKCGHYKKWKEEEYEEREGSKRHERNKKREGVFHEVKEKTLYKNTTAKTPKDVLKNILGKEED